MPVHLEQHIMASVPVNLKQQITTSVLVNLKQCIMASVPINVETTRFGKCFSQSKTAHQGNQSTKVIKNINPQMCVTFLRIIK